MITAPVSMCHTCRNTRHVPRRSWRDYKNTYRDSRSTWQTSNPHGNWFNSDAYLRIVAAAPGEADLKPCPDCRTASTTPQS